MNILRSYVEGSWVVYASPWAHVDFVYFPCIHRTLEHWWLVVLDINRRTLTFYDSMMAHESHNIQVRKTAEPLVKLLLHVLDDIGVFKERPGVKQRSDLFILKVCHDFPQ